MNRQLLLTVAALASALAVAPCQSTLTVGPGGYAHIDAAIAAASPGDVLVVMPGTYPGFAVTKGVTIRPAVAGTVTFAGTFVYISAQVPPGETAHLARLQLPVMICTGGRLALEDCTVAPGHVAVQGGSLVVLEGCTVNSQATFAAIRADQQSELVAVDSTIAFTPLLPWPGAARSAVEVAGGSRFRGSRLQLTSSSSALAQAGAAVVADAGSSVWVSDSTLVAAGTCAIEAPNGRHDRCVLTPNCSTLPAGFVLGAHRVAPLQNGAPFTVEYTLQPGMAVGVLAAPTFASQTYPELEQSLLLPAASAFPLAALVADGQGLASGTWNVPAGPQFVDRTLWLQGFTGFALPLQASPLVGGVVR
jgi:hypothetical protein